VVRKIVLNYIKTYKAKSNLELPLSKNIGLDENCFLCSVIEPVEITERKDQRGQ